MEPMHAYVMATIKIDEEVLRQQLVADRRHREKVRRERRERTERRLAWVRNRRPQVPARARTWQTSIDRA